MTDVPPGSSVGTLVARDGQGAMKPTAAFTFQRVDADPVSRTPFTVHADDTATVTGAFITGAVYVGWESAGGAVRPLWQQLARFTVPAGPFAIPPLLLSCSIGVTGPPGRGPG